MCDLNGKFTICFCSGDIALSKPHWEFNEVTFTSTTWITEVGKEFRKHLST